MLANCNLQVNKPQDTGSELSMDHYKNVKAPSSGMVRKRKKSFIDHPFNLITALLIIVLNCGGPYIPTCGEYLDVFRENNEREQHHTRCDDLFQP